MIKAWQEGPARVAIAASTPIKGYCNTVFSWIDSISSEFYSVDRLRIDLLFFSS